MVVLFIIIGMVPMTIAIFLGCEVAGRDNTDSKSKFGFISSVLLFFSGIALLAGLFAIDSEDEWYWWIIIFAILLVVAIIFYRLWKR